MDAQCCKHWRHHLKPPLKALRIAPFFPRPARLCDGGKTRITHFAHVRKGFDIFCPNRCFHTQNVFLINWPDFLERRAVRCVALADVFDALVSRRPYKEVWSLEKVKEEIAAQRGKQFAPDVVDVFLREFDKFEKICESVKQDDTENEL